MTRNKCVVTNDSTIVQKRTIETHPRKIKCSFVTAKQKNEEPDYHIFYERNKISGSLVC